MIIGQRVHYAERVVAARRSRKADILKAHGDLPTPRVTVFDGELDDVRSEI